MEDDLRVEIKKEWTKYRFAAEIEWTGQGYN